MAEIGMALSLIGFVVFVIVVCSVYAAQKWAHRCFKELEKLNAKINSLTKS